LIYRKIDGVNLKSKSMKFKIRFRLVGLGLIIWLPLQIWSQTLYVGTNYHPHDNKNPDKIKQDIELMKAAGFNVVRMGHLAWASYEPSDGVFDFGWFDQVMDQMDKAGIKVILDIAIRPAPIWLHKKIPSIDVVNSDGDVQYPNHRYMDDVGDPNYQQYAVRFADAISKHYAKHPALWHLASTTNRVMAPFRILKRYVSGLLFG
jgi:beta-galactosidase